MEQFKGAYQQGLLAKPMDMASFDPYAAGATGVMFAPGSGVADVLGYAPDPMSKGQNLPSMMQNIRGGQYADAAGQGLGLLGDAFMAAGTVVPPLLPVGAAMKAPRAARVGIRAYHGSPYDFERFDVGKIGTGEKAQMYGHGLYFAENPKVARDYRNQLTQPPFEYKIGGKSVPKMYEDAINRENYELAEVLEQVQLHDTPTDLKSRFTVGEGYSQETEDFVKSLDYDNLKGFDEEGVEVPLGRQYEVNIAADPEMMLDYQFPLTDQPEAVQNAIKQIYWDNFISKDPTLVEVFGAPENLRMSDLDLFDRSIGGQVYNTLAAKFGSKEAASRAMQEAGIPGIKYLDLGSRTGAKSLADATSNYVVFDDSLIEIMRKYGLLAPLVGAGTVAAVSDTGEDRGLLEM